MKEAEVIWHPYPQEKPTDGLDVIVITEGKIKPYLYIVYFSNGKFLLRGHEDMSVVDVYAWSEIPKHYEGANT